MAAKVTKTDELQQALKSVGTVESREAGATPVTFDFSYRVRVDYGSIFLGIGGAHQESALYARSWGFQLEDITTEVHLWHGEKDNNVVCSVGHYVADTIPDCQPTFFEDEGHFSVFYNHIEEILGVLAA